MKKLFTFVVVIATIVSTLGLTAIVPAASAASTGDKIKVAGNPAVYYVSGSSKHLFSNEKTFWTWYSGTWGNNPVMTVSQSEFDGFTTGSNVIARAGSLVKFDNSPKVYIVGENGVLYNITEDAAKAWFGNDYSTKVNIIQSSFEANYTKSSDVLTSSSKVPNGTLVKYTGSEDVYLIQDGKKRLVTDEGFTANKFKDSAVVTIPASMTFTTGSSITGTESTVWNVAGAAGSSDNGGDTTVNGTDGTISDVTELSQYNNEEVGEGKNDVKIAGFEVEASKEGDVKLRSMKVTFDSTGNTGSDKLDHYVDSVSVWMGSKKVGSADASDFNEDSSTVYSKTITLDNNVIVDADTSDKFYITVDAVSNLDGSDISGDSWTVDLANIRYEDGSGVVSTDDSTGDIGSLDVPVDFVTFSAAADTELKISTASNTPDAGIVIIDDQENTDDVTLLKGKVEVEGDSDVLIDEFPVTLTTVGGANLAAVTGSLKLTIDGEEYTESVTISGSTTGTVTFDNLDLNISAGDTVDFTVSADINDIDAGNLDEGDTLVASVTSTNRDYIDAENEEGDQLSDSTEKSGTATGEAQEFRTTGVQLTLVSASTSVAAGTSSNDDQGTFTMKFKVKAIGDTVYVSSLADGKLSGVTTGKTSVLVDRAGTATVGGVSVTITNITDNDLNSAGLYEIEEGSEETFEVTTTVQLPAAGSGGQFRAVLGGLSWTTDSTDATPDNAYTSNLDTFKTSYIGLN